MTGVASVLFGREEIRRRVEELGRTITVDHQVDEGAAVGVDEVVHEVFVAVTSGGRGCDPRLHRPRGIAG